MRLRSRTIRYLSATAVFALVAVSCGTQVTPSTSPPSSSTSASASVTRSSTPSATPSGTIAPGVWHMLPRLALSAKADFYSTTLTWDGADVVLTGRLGFRGPPYGRSMAAAYDPQGDGWWRLPPFPGPRGQFEGTDNAVWDGTELIVWGITDAAYRPATQRWRALPPGGFGGGGDVAVWTGHQTLGFGGGCCDQQNQMYASYTPATNSWSQPPSGPLAGRYGPAAVWTGKEFIVAGGETNVYRNTGGGPTEVIDRDAASYNPRTKTWRKLPPMPVARDGGSAIWDGHEMIVVGGGVARGVAFDPVTNVWRWLPPMRYVRTGQVAVWTGNQVLVWGGHMGPWQHPVAPPHGEAYDPTTDRWTAMTPSPLHARVGALAVWTGTQMIVWGGRSLDGRSTFYDGAAFTPGTT